MIETWLLQRFVLPLNRTALELRRRLLILAVIPLAALLGLLFQATIVFGLSWWGVFLPVIRQGLGEEPANWIFWIADPSLLQVSAFAVLGLVSGAVFGRWPVASSIALIFIFPGFLSIKGFVALFFAERWGRRARLAFRDKNSSLNWSLLSGLIVLIAWVMFGSALQYGLAHALELGSIFHPTQQLGLTLMVVGLGLCLELAVNFVVFHFHFLTLTKA